MLDWIRFRRAKPRRPNSAEINHSLRGCVPPDVAYGVIYVIVCEAACVNGSIMAKRKKKLLLSDLYPELAAEREVAEGGGAGEGGAGEEGAEGRCNGKG